MASPKLEAFAIFNLSTGAPMTGQAGSMSFLTYKDDTGVNVTPVPTIVEIGGGWYGFLPSFPANPNKGVVYTVDTGPNANPTKVTRYMRPEDYNADAIPTIQALAERIRDFGEGKWEIATTGPNANHFIVYAADGVTVLRKYQLLDASGLPTTTNPYKRSPNP